MDSAVTETFLTELEDTDEIQQDNIDEPEKLDQLEQVSDYELQSLIM